MVIDKEGITSASKNELLAFWIIDNDLFRLFPFGEFVIRCKGQGVTVHGT
jgi:hypothetical protein